MNGDTAGQTARLCVRRKEFIKALLAVRRQCRRQPEATITLDYRNTMLHMTLGDLTISVSAHGDWPVPVLVSPTFIHTVALLPPAEDPVAIRIDGRFIQIGSTAMEYQRT